MDSYYSHSWFDSLGGFFWFGILTLTISIILNCGYAYRTFHRSSGTARKQPLDILNARYARGEISREEYQVVKFDLMNKRSEPDRQQSSSQRPSPA